MYSFLPYIIVCTVLIMYMSAVYKGYNYLPGSWLIFIFTSCRRINRNILNSLYLSMQKYLYSKHETKFNKMKRKKLFSFIINSCIIELLKGA